MVTYSVPVRSTRDGRFLGVATSDVSLVWITRLLRGLPLGKEGYAFLISANGTFISHPSARLIMKETIFSLAEDKHSEILRDTGRAMLRGKSGFVPWTSVVTDLKGWLVYAPVASTKWSLGLVLPARELEAKVLALNRMQATAGFAGLVLLVLITIYIARSIARPLRQLQAVDARSRRRQPRRGDAEHQGRGRGGRPRRLVRRHARQSQGPHCRPEIHHRRQGTHRERDPDRQVDPDGPHPQNVPALPGRQGVRPFRNPRTGARGGRRFLRLLHGQRHDAVLRHRRRLGQGRAGRAVHGGDAHLPAPYLARRTRPRRHSGAPQ